MRIRFVKFNEDSFKIIGNNLKSFASALGCEALTVPDSNNFHLDKNIMILCFDKKNQQKVFFAIYVWISIFS